MYAGVEIGIKFCDGPGHLRSHLDRDHRIDGSSGFHNIMDVASLDLRGEVLRLSIPVQPKDNEQSSYDHNDRYDEPLAFCHLSLVSMVNNRSLVSQRLDRIKPRRLTRRVVSEENSDSDGKHGSHEDRLDGHLDGPTQSL